MDKNILILRFSCFISKCERVFILELIDIISDRAKLYDIYGDGSPKLITIKLSNIFFSDPKTGKVVKKFTIKPKVEKHVVEYERNLLRSISGDSLIERTSVSGEIIIKFDLADINNDGIVEIVLLRADGIMACYDTYGKELWSVYKDRYVVDFCISDIDSDGYPEVVAISRMGIIYIINRKGKVFSFTLKNTYGSPSHICCYHEQDGSPRVAVLMRDGLLYFFGVTHKGKEFYKKEEKLEILNTVNLPKTGEPVAFCRYDVDGDGVEEFIVGLSDGAVAIVNPSSGLLKSLRLEDKIAFAVPLKYLNLTGIFIGDWLGNAVIISKSTITRFDAPSKRSRLDIDGDGTREDISVMAKRIVVRRERQELFSIEGRNYISAFNICDINNDDCMEILLGWNSRSISIYSCDGKRISAISTTTVPRVILAIDIDGDQKKELLCGGDGALEIYRPPIS